MARFIIKSVTTANYISHYWKLIDFDGKVVLKSELFNSEKETRANISLVKKCVTKFTKVEVET